MQFLLNVPLYVPEINYHICYHTYRFWTWCRWNDIIVMLKNKRTKKYDETRLSEEPQNRKLKITLFNAKKKPWVFWLNILRKITRMSFWVKIFFAVLMFSYVNYCTRALVFMRPKSFGVKLLLICISLGLATASCYKVESQRAISENTFLWYIVQQGKNVIRGNEGELLVPENLL